METQREAPRARRLIPAPWRRVMVALLGSTALSLAFIFGRHFQTGRGTYDFLAWNLFLAWVPLGFAAVARRLASSWHGTPKRRAWGLALAGAAWFVFLPNAPYIVTDLMHLRNNRGAPLWFDLLMVATTAWTGLLVGLASLRLMHGVAHDVGVPRAQAAVAVAVVCFASAFGVFIGRFLRWNSWDVLTNPGALVVDTWQALGEGDILVFTLAFGLFLWIAYLTVCSVGLALPAAADDA